MNTQMKYVDPISAAREAEDCGDWDLALSCYDQALQQALDADNHERAAEALRWMGRVHFERGAYDRASELYQGSLAQAQVAGLRAHAASALNCLATTAQMRGNLDVAQQFYERAREIAEQECDRVRVARVNQNMGTLAAIRGDTAGALDHMQRAVTELKHLGDNRSAAYVLNNMGMVSVDTGDLGAAAISFSAASELAEQARDMRMLGRIEVNRAEMHLKASRFDEARTSCDRAAQIFGQLQSDSGLAETHKAYGVLFRETAQMRRAHNELSIALRLARSCDNPLLEAETESEVARVYLAEGLTREALRSLNSAYRKFDELEARRELQDVQRRLDRMEDAYERALQMFDFESVETTDHYATGRNRRVADLACKLAETVGYNSRELTWLRIGAYLYDVGKVSVPSHVLNKPGPLDANEWEMVRHHPVSSATMVADLDFPSGVLPLVRSHHEAWDGTGYPDGLCGDDIPLGARILGLADAFDALTSPRSFRPALNQTEALQTMRSEVGQKFDPELFRLFCGVVGDDSRAA